jgi:hypothetical protein
MGNLTSRSLYLEKRFLLRSSWERRRLACSGSGQDGSAPQVLSDAHTLERLSVRIYPPWLWLGAASHLCQRGLCLWQPEGHLHGTVQLDSGRQRSTGLLPLTGLGVKSAEAEVAVGLAWAHAQFLDQGESLLVVDFSLRDIGGGGVGMDGTKLVQRESRPRAPSAAGPWSSIRMACSRSPWVRYRRPRQPWTTIGVSPRPASVARRSASSPWCRPSAKAPSALKVRASLARDWIRTSVLCRVSHGGVGQVPPPMR